ncbi:MAG: macro domain-containing protein [Acidobacteria bacterium]|nr:macro domain-containing protein [Planctomycetota bacterium]MBE3133642.1 macro domain-containing protein [Acidobacteriota bacterium]
MITVRIGDIFESNAQTLVNTVNCVGVMGKGIALEFRKRFPEMHEDYVRRCNAGKVRLGEPYVYESLAPPWILNFPTKDHWRSVSRLQDIVAGLQYLQAHYREWGITSLAVPPLGCGQGQLEWRVVGPTLYRHLKQLGIPMDLFAPFGTPHEELRPAFLDDAGREQPAPSRQDASYRVPPAWIALVEILRGIEREPYHWPVGRTTFQKIAYFATESGIPTGLQYKRGSFGPYAPDLKRHVTALVNNGLVREERLGRMFAVRTGETFDDARRAYADQIGEWRDAIDKITDLFMRMNTQQAEVAATVYFAAAELRQAGKAKPAESDVLRQVMQWKQKRRPPLDEKEVALTIRNLNMLSWLGAEVSEDLPVTEEEVLNV